MTHQFHSTTLREYDIRGIIGETLGEADAYAIGRGFGTRVARVGGRSVVVGYDGRLSSPMLPICWACRSMPAARISMPPIAS